MRFRGPVRAGSRHPRQLLLVRLHLSSWSAFGISLPVAIPNGFQPESNGLPPPERPSSFPRIALLVWRPMSLTPALSVASHAPDTGVVSPE